MKIRLPYVSLLLALLLVACSGNSGEGDSPAGDQTSRAGNPVIEGWYADPEGNIFGDTYWIFPTFSDYYGEPDILTGFSAEQRALRENAINDQYLIQTYFDAFSSKDLVNWTKHEKVLKLTDISWGAYSLWAPSAIQANGRYYLFFSANDIQSDDEPGGIGVAVADQPEGPYRDALGEPLIDEFHNGAQPIDQFVFRDDDGQIYMYYGGWGHCNVVKLGDDLLSLETFEDGTTFKEITPENYVEGSFVFKREGKYYFMWSEGGWMGPNYSVAYAIGDSPTGPFERVRKILQQDSTVARGAGHHSVIHPPGSDDWYIVYHRRPLDTDDPHHRSVSIDRMYFDENGLIKPVEMTFKGVKARPLE